MEPLRRAGRGVRRLGKRRVRFRFAFRFRVSGLPAGRVERCWVEIRRGDKVGRTGEEAVGSDGSGEVSWEENPVAAEFTMYQSMLGGSAGGSAGGWVPVGAGGRLERKGARLEVLARDAMLRTVAVGAATVDLARFARVEADTKTVHLAVPMDGIDPDRTLGTVLHVQVESTCLSFLGSGDAGSEVSQGAGSFVTDLDDPSGGDPVHAEAGAEAGAHTGRPDVPETTSPRYRPPPLRGGAIPPLAGGRPPLPPVSSSSTRSAEGLRTGPEGLRRRASPSPADGREAEQGEERQAPAGEAEGGTPRAPGWPWSLALAPRRAMAKIAAAREFVRPLLWVDILEVGVHFMVTLVACLLAICIAAGYIP